jgi:hypothetical protein
MPALRNTDAVPVTANNLCLDDAFEKFHRRAVYGSMEGMATGTVPSSKLFIAPPRQAEYAGDMASGLEIARGKWTNPSRRQPVNPNKH